MAGEAGLLVAPHDEGTFTLLRKASRLELRVDLINLIAVEGLAENDVGLQAKLIVDTLTGRVRDRHNRCPQRHAGGIALLQASELGAGRVKLRGIGLG